MTFVFLYDQIFNSNDIQLIIEFFPEIVRADGFYFSISIVFVLLIVNYLFESIKWQFFIGKLEKVSLPNAIRAILTGISISMFMPNRVGDYLGRIFILKKANRIKAILATILGSMSQLIATILFGSVSVLFAFPKFMQMNDSFNKWIYALLLVVVVVGLSVIIFAYLNFGEFSLIIKRISGRGYRKIEKYAEVFSLYKVSDLSYVLLISILRYLVFSFQFVLLLWIFQVEISYFNAMMLIGLVYLGVTVIPTIALTEIGVRGSVSIFVFSYYFQNNAVADVNLELGVVSASTALWLINLVLPAMVGAIFVFGLKFFRKSPDNGSLD
jgi:hypothetical protein